MTAESVSKEGRNAQQEALERAPAATPHSASFAVLAVAVLGVVYGDIGTSPIYALRECFAGKNTIPVTPDNVLGILSLIFWTLLLVISLKYMIYVLRADTQSLVRLRLPALLLNYFGQGALLIADPSNSIHPFFQLAPSWGLYPLIILATAATVIASQAVITGAYSLTRQAMQLGLFPRLTVAQTSADARGQIYMPAVNWILMIAAIGLVLAFHSSGNLAAAYGVAVNSTMAITTVLAFRVARERGGWKLPAALAFLIGFLAIDLGFLGSNLLKIPDGGWLPLLIGALLYTVMTTWRRGAEMLAEQIANTTPSLETFIGRVIKEHIPRIPGTGVFFTGRLDQTPPSLQKLVRHTNVLYENVIVVTVVIEPVPTTSSDERMEFTQLDIDFYRIVLRYGFMQTPNIPSELSACAKFGLALDLDQIHYLIGHVDLLAGRKRHGMVIWRDKLFSFMAGNTEDATATYHLPAAQVMTVGLQVGI